MMGRRPDHRIRMMSQVAFTERSILLDLCTWQDQRSRAVGLKKTDHNYNFSSVQYFVILLRYFTLVFYIIYYLYLVLFCITFYISIINT